MNARSYSDLVAQHMLKCLKDSNLPYPKYSGKVRDCYDLGDEMLLVATDRLSAFDRFLTCIPFKGQILNQISAWWFRRTRHIIPNHFICLHSPNVMRVKKCKIFPIEVVVRGYLTGSTGTSIWTLYNQGQRQFFSTLLPDGLQKNARLPEPILTPTTKSKFHDEPLSPDNITQHGISQEQWEYIAAKAIHLFQFAQQRAEQANLVLVDTKFEFGEDSDGQLLLVDECLTPDSSRYWHKDSFEALIQQGQEPESYDKELLRLWYRQHCDPYQDLLLPEPPDSLKSQLASRYIELYEALTGELFALSVHEDRLCVG